MTRDQAFLQAILDSPDDDAPRLVYADWLEERGDPRGEFIRLQCALARMDEHDPRRPEIQARADGLLALHAAVWAGPLPEWAAGCEFHRGFVDVLRVDSRQFLRTVSRNLEGPTPDAGPTPPSEELLLGPAIGSPLLSLVRGIRVRGLPTIFRDFWPVADWLQTADTLLRSPTLARLCQLDLEGNELGDAGLEWVLLLFRRGTVRLQVLNLRANYLTARAAQGLAAAPALGALTELDLGFNILGPAGAMALAGSEHFGRVRTLRLDDCRLGTSGVRALINSALLPRLTALDLGSNALSDAGVVSVAEAPAIRGLTTLILNNNGIGDVGAEALVRSANLDGLRTLQLLNNWSISTELRLALRERFGDRIRL
jgi:uncharacterized protein (TIGR02996 family)